MNTRHRHGRLAEDAALEFLVQRQLVLLQRNYRTPRGEIDLIMRDGDTVVFVEVRARTRADFLSPVETVSHHKQRRIILAGRSWLQHQRGTYDTICRFDVVSIIGSSGRAEIEWIRNAFEA